MFEDVAQMEKEIETFRKNVVASSELVEGISRLTEAARQQTESFSTSANDLLEQLDSCTKEIKADHASALKTLSNNNSAAITRLQENASADLQAKLSEIEKIRLSIESCRTETTKKADEQLQHLSEESERLIAELRHETTAQMESFSTSADRIIKKFDSCTEEIKADHASTLKTLSDNNSDAITRLQENASADLQAKLSEIEKIRLSIESCRTETTKKADEQLQHLSEESERLIAKFQQELSAQQAEFGEKLQQYEKTINGYQTDAGQKYIEFINRLETTNVDQIYKEVLGLKQSFKARFLVVMAGIGIVLVVAVLGLILK